MNRYTFVVPGKAADAPPIFLAAARETAKKLLVTWGARRGVAVIEPMLTNIVRDIQGDWIRAVAYDRGWNLRELGPRANVTTNPL